MPDPVPQQNSVSTSAPAPVDLSGLRTRTVQQARDESTKAGNQMQWMSPGEGLVEETPIGQAYKHAQGFLSKWEGKLSEKYLAPFRQGLDNMAEDLQQAGESGHTKSGGQLTGPTRAMAEGVGSLLKQIPVGKDVKSTAQALVVPPELPEARGLSQEIRAGEKTAVNLEGLRTRPVSEVDRLFDEALAKLPETKKSAAKTALNASGESAASQEAINRVASEKRQGTKRYAVDSRSGTKKPLIGPDAVDYKPQKFEHVITEDARGNKTLLDSGSSARPWNP